MDTSHNGVPWSVFSPDMGGSNKSHKTLITSIVAASSWNHTPPFVGWMAEGCVQMEKWCYTSPHARPQKSSQDLNIAQLLWYWVAHVHALSWLWPMSTSYVPDVSVTFCSQGVGPSVLPWSIRLASKNWHLTSRYFITKLCSSFFSVLKDVNCMQTL